MKDLPNAIEAEQALLGVVLIGVREAMERVVRFLLPEHFYEPLHQRIYAAALRLFETNRSTVLPALKVEAREIDWDLLVGREEKDGRQQDVTAFRYAVKLAAENTGYVNAEHFGLAIVDAWRRRSIIQVCRAGEEMADVDIGPDAAKNVADWIESEISKIRAAPSAASKDDECGAGQAYLDDLDARQKRNGQQGVPMPFAEMARVLSEPSFEAGNLYGMLSSSGEGKTSLLLQILFHAAKRGHPVVYFSYDQSKSQIVRQLVSQNLDIEARRQKDWDGMSRPESEAAINFARKFDTLPFHIHRATDEGIGRLGSVARRILRPYKGGPSPLIALDHIMRVTLPDDMRRANEGARALAVTSPAKTMAEQCEAAFLMVNQRNSTGVKRFNPRPTLADLYGGEPARYDYDTILGLFRRKKWRDERLKVAENENEEKKIHKLFPVYPGEPDDVAELSALKVRYGDPSIVATLEFEARFTRYRSMQVRGNMFDD